MFRSVQTSLSTNVRLPYNSPSPRAEPRRVSTPIRLQYLELKQRYLDTILFFSRLECHRYLEVDPAIPDSSQHGRPSRFPRRAHSPNLAQTSEARTPVSARMLPPRRRRHYTVASGQGACPAPATVPRCPPPSLLQPRHAAGSHTAERGSQQGPTGTHSSLVRSLFLPVRHHVLPC